MEQAQSDKTLVEQVVDYLLEDIEKSEIFDSFTMETLRRLGDQDNLTNASQIATAIKVTEGGEPS